MVTTEPNEAAETAVRVQAAHREDGGQNLDAHLDGFMSGIETVLANQGVDRAAYLSELARLLEERIGAQGASGSDFLQAALGRVKAAQGSAG